MNMNELLERVTETGGPFSPWVTVTPNKFGGFDIANTRTGETFRIAVDDNEVTLYVFSNGPALVLNGSQTFRGFLADPAFIAPALLAVL